MAWLQHHGQIVSQIKTERALNNQVQIKKTSTVKKFFPPKQKFTGTEMATTTWRQWGDILLLLGTDSATLPECAPSWLPLEWLRMNTPLLTTPAPPPDQDTDKQGLC